MTTVPDVAGRSRSSAAEAGLAPDVAAEPLRAALAGLLLALADDEFVIGFTDSEWTGIAPLLEEDVAMSSLSQDELGHARALYELLGGVLGRDPDEVAYDREPEAFRHARLLDGGRGDWAATIARRYLYDTADSVRLESLAASSWAPLAGLMAKIRREETYHLLHAEAWLLRLADGGEEPRRRLEAAMEALAPQAWTVLAELPGEAVLVEAGVMPDRSSELDARWRSRIEPVLASAGLRAPEPAPGRAGGRDAPRTIPGAREGHGEAFRRLHADFTSVRRLEPGATW